MKKVTPTSTTTYIGQLYECTGGVCTKYIFAGSERIANIKGTETYYYHTDHLGSSNIITDTAGNKVEDMFYYPYGEMKYHTGTYNVKHKFTGQEYDAETGLYYYGARYYDPKLARFISADTIVPEPFNPQALNRYSYVINNPLLYTDPTGRIFGIDDLFIIIVGAVIGAISAGAQSDWDVGAMVQGAVVGAVSGAVGGAVGGYVGGAMSSAGYSATVSSVVAGSAGGMAAGATSAALTGGNIGQSALIGGVAGGIGGYIGYATRGWGDVYQGLAQVGTGGVVGGTVSELTGGTFWEGFKTGGIAAAAAFAVSKFFENNTKIGEMSEEKAQWDMNLNEGERAATQMEGYTPASQKGEQYASGATLFLRPWWATPRGVPADQWFKWSEYNLPPELYPKPTPRIPWWQRPWDWHKWKPEPPHPELPEPELKA